MCFEILGKRRVKLGFDIMCNSKGHAILIEVNHSPSFTCDSELDLLVKENIVNTAIGMANLSP